MVARAVSVLPSYLLTLVILTLVGAIASVYFIGYYSPLSKQEPYIGAAVRYTYKVESNAVTISVANSKDYPAKIDVFLLTTGNMVLTACNGSMYYQTKAKVVNGALQLLGIRLEPHEIVTIVCFERHIRDVKVFEHGVEVSERAVVMVGWLPSWHGIANVQFGIGSPWVAYGFGYRLPVTLVVTKPYSRVYSEIVINRNTVGDQLFNFIYSNTRPDGKDFLVVTAKGNRLPTSAQKTGNTITVTFELTNVAPGVYRFYLYFGKPDLNQEINPIKSNPPWSPKITTPSNGLPRNYLSSEFVYPAYVIPEANWYPDWEEMRHGHLRTAPNSFIDFDRWVETFVKMGTYDTIKQILSASLSNRKSYPVGTQINPLSGWFHRDYRNLIPKTVYEYGPWATLTVVPLPSFAPNTLVYDVRTLLYVASDDGSAAYVIGLRHIENSVYKMTYYNDLDNTHGPRYAGHMESSNWNYEYNNVVLQKQNVEGAEMFLVVIQQNGIRSGTGPGWIDFRFVMWWIEKPYTYHVPGFPQDVSQGGWLTGWRYRKGLDVLGDVLGPIDNYVLRIVVRYGSGRDSYDTMHCDGKCRTDFGDVRFTASDGRTAIQYCMVTKVNGEYAVFYIRIRRPGLGEKTRVYVYYGNDQATSESNCRAVFGRDIAFLYNSDEGYDALILSSREWIDGGSYLCVSSDLWSCFFDLPFKIKIYDEEVSCLYASIYGFATWNCEMYNSYFNFLDVNSKMLAPHWDDLYNTTVLAGTGYDNVLGQFAFLTWRGLYWECKFCTTTLFQILLYRNWVVQFNINTIWSDATPSEFISAGNGLNYIDLTPRWIYLESVLFVPRFRSVYGSWSPEEMMQV
ncbi:MAG: DUF2341 domain-containing protein [Desulfurococcaceae archaeon]